MADILDAHVHIGRSIQGFGHDVPRVLAEMDRLGIELAIVVPVRPYDYVYRSQNDLVAQARRDHPDRFYAVGRVDPRLTDAAVEAERCVTDLGLQGIYVDPWEDALCVADHRYDPVLRVCTQYKVPLMVATGYLWVSEAPQVADLARRFPEVPIVMTNGGQINISGLGQRNSWLALAECANVYMTTSGVYREDFLEEVLEQIGHDKVLFGSQSPLFDQDFELHRILWAHVEEAVKEQVLRHNAQRIFRVPSRDAPR
jgi:uncharacterized protein